jgi:ribosomal-protein-alanine N-acetyltransferase
MDGIRTPRLLLRRFRSEDAPSLYRWASDPKVAYPAAWNPHSSVEESRHIIETVFSAPLTWAITLRADSGSIHAGDVIGAIGLSTIDPADRELADPAVPPASKSRESERELGYWIARPLWGRGIATEAAHAVVSYGFRMQNLTAIWGRHMVSNIGSDRVMQHCSMTVVRHASHVWMPIVHEYRDELVRRVTREQYEQSQREQKQDGAQQ